MKERLLVLPVCFLLASLATAQTQLGARLTGNNEVPPIPTTATGTAWLSLYRPANILAYRVTVTGMSGTVAHIHTGAAGVSGAPLFPLTGGPTTWEGSVTLSNAQVATLANQGLYINVHSAIFPGGEIRGQIIPMSRIQLAATPSGTQEVPPSPSGGSAAVTLWLERPVNTITYDVFASGLIGTGTASHIHTGAAGVAGPVLRALNGGPAHWCGTTAPLSDAEAATVLAGGTYVNIHSTVFGGGEIRGQITQANLAYYVAVLDGSQENPAIGSAGTGLGRFTLDLAANTLAYDIQVSGLSGTITAAHIHTGALGNNGGVRLALPGTSGTWSGVWSAASSPPFAAADIDNLRGQRFYVNVHSTVAPGGEIRGQIEANPKRCGFGAEGSPGGVRTCEFSGSPAIGGTATIRFLGGAPFDTALLFIADAATQFSGSPLPQNLGGGNWIWVDATALVYLTLFADDAGCAELSVGIPNDPLIRGIPFYLQWLGAGTAGISTSGGMKLVIQ